MPVHAYEVRPRRDHRGVNLISNALPFGRLWVRWTKRNRLRKASQPLTSRCDSRLRWCWQRDRKPTSTSEISKSREKTCSGLFLGSIQDR